MAVGLFWHKQFFIFNDKKVVRKWQEQNRYMEDVIEYSSDQLTIIMSLTHLILPHTANTYK